MVGRPGLENKGAAKQKGGPPYFFRTPPRGGVQKKSGVRKERGVHAPRAPPLSTLMNTTYILFITKGCHRGTSLQLAIIYTPGMILTHSIELIPYKPTLNI